MVRAQKNYALSFKLQRAQLYRIESSNKEKVENAVKNFYCKNSLLKYTFSPRSLFVTDLYQ